MIEFHDNVVRKTARPSMMAIEIAKTRAAIEIGDSSGAFYVPRVLRFDEDAGVADFERIDDLATLHMLLRRKDPRLEDILRRAARVLPLIHARLQLPSDMRIPLPPQWMTLPVEHVFLHGDFSLDNVCIHEPTNRLVIVDWSSAPFLEQVATLGPKYFDVLWFISNIFDDTIRRFWSASLARTLADVFLNAYATQRGGNLDRDLFRTFRAGVQRITRKALLKRLSRQPWIRRTLYDIRACYVLRAFTAYEPACFRRP